MCKAVGYLGCVRSAHLPQNVTPAIVAMENVTFDATALVEMELGGLTPGSEHDQLNVSVLLTLDGTLSVLVIPGFNPQSGDAFDLLDWVILSGTFATVLLPNLSNGLTWDVSHLYLDGAISVTQVPEPSSLLLLALGAAVVAVAHRRRLRSRSGGDCE